MVTDMMIDLETLSTRASAVVVSLGAIVFNMRDEITNTQVISTYYEEFAIQEQIDKGCKVDESTIRWWMEKDIVVRKIMTDNGYRRCDVKNGLARFSVWVERFNSEVKRIWSHGEAFDLAILPELYAQYNVPCRLDHRKFRDTKTLFDWGKKEEYEKLLRPKGETEHHALRDAINQASAAQFVWRNLRRIVDAEESKKKEFNAIAGMIDSEA